MSIVSLSCSSSKKNIVTCGGILNTSKLSVLEVIINSVNYNSESKIIELTGKVLDSANREKIVGANLILTPREKEPEGTATNLEGKFVLKFNKTEYDSIDVRYILFERKMLSISDIYKNYYLGK